MEWRLRHANGPRISLRRGRKPLLGKFGATNSELKNGNRGPVLMISGGVERAAVVSNGL
jgi:hypothetical protein